MQRHSFNKTAFLYCIHLHLWEILNYYALNSLSITAFQFKILEFKINIFHFISNIWQKIAFPINSLSFLLCIRGRGVDRIGNILKAEDFSSSVLRVVGQSVVYKYTCIIRVKTQCQMLLSFNENSLLFDNIMWCCLLWWIIILSLNTLPEIIDNLGTGWSEDRAEIDVCDFVFRRWGHQMYAGCRNEPFDIHYQLPVQSHHIFHF